MRREERDRGRESRKIKNCRSKEFHELQVLAMQKKGFFVNLIKWKGETSRPQFFAPIDTPFISL